MDGEGEFVGLLVSRSRLACTVCVVVLAATVRRVGRGRRRASLYHPVASRLRPVTYVLVAVRCLFVCLSLRVCVLRVCVCVLRVSPARLDRVSCSVRACDLS